MFNRCSITIVCLVAVANGVMCGQQAAGLRELRDCLDALAGEAVDTTAPQRAFGILLPGQQEVALTVELAGDQLVALDATTFWIRRGADGRGLELDSIDGKHHKAITAAELHSYRPILSLDPGWVVCRLLREPDRYEYLVDEKRQRATFSRREWVPLADPSERLYGQFEEVVEVDTQGHTILSYRATAWNEDRQPVRDVHNTYHYHRAPSPEWIQVTQSDTAGRRGVQVFQVVY
ncbi:MAG TPA: hypothetical protein PKG76_17175 [Acidobacteriota bacterium]|nr:hypothetical protein [Acidobacteriota bacterium]